MIGYNINHYDKYILQAILCDFNPYEISDWIINQDKHGWMFSKTLNRFPIITFDTMIKDKGLKQCEASLGLEIVESSIPFDINRKITKSEMKELIKYCKYDVESTMEVFLQDGFYLSPQDEWSSSLAIIKEFELPISYLSKTKAQLGCAVLGANRKKLPDDEFDIISPTNLKLGKYEHVREWFLNPENHWYNKTLPNRKRPIKNEYVTDIAGLPHTFAWGGVHGSVERCIVDGILLMADFGSLYPNIMVKYGLISRGVPNQKSYINLLETRLRLKAQGDSREKSYKIALNGSYGQMKYEMSPLYDPKMANNVCVHGQLIILDLIEKLEKHGEILNSNTDGVMIKVESEEEKKIVEDICKETSERLMIPIDIDEYKRFIVKDVNNYLAITNKGKVKAKGSYVKYLTPFEMSNNIVNIAIREYFINNTPVSKTVNSCNNIMDFQIIAKAGKKYEYAHHNGKRLNEKVNRVFASTSDSDTSISKFHKEDKRLKKIESTPNNCFIINGDVREMGIPRKLNRNWYILEAERKIKEFVK